MRYAASSRKYCGNKNPNDIEIKGDTVGIVFHSDDYYSKTGFRLSYSFIPDKSLCIFFILFDLLSLSYSLLFNRSF